MEGILNAQVRMEKPKVSRREGFIPGVIYGKDLENIFVKFEKTKLIGLLKEKGEKSRISFLLNNKKQEGIIKDVARDDSTNEIIHIDIQAVKGTEVVKWTVPVNFTGKELLNGRGLYLQVYSNEIEVEGESSLIPNSVEIEVSKMEFGQEIKIKDLKLTGEIRILKDLDTVIGVIANS
ncbi:50S ribosomal protein L25 [Clostridium malenominatum]|uniref:Large ribosomal subunit protein bL25 n=1 Tax=Clostridium malenominatum TaxID=1539 RepID=A0ABP3U001_9CLOT